MFSFLYLRHIISLHLGSCKDFHEGVLSEQYCRLNGMLEAIFQWVVIAEGQFPSLVTYFRESKKNM